jgi:hypothetical protein
VVTFRDAQPMLLVILRGQNYCSEHLEALSRLLGVTAQSHPTVMAITEVILLEVEAEPITGARAVAILTHIYTARALTNKSVTTRGGTVW